MADQIKNFVIVGASRGIGAEVANHLDTNGNKIYTISRSKSSVGIWIQADISTTEGINKIKQIIGSETIDALLFMGGVWEKNAFTQDYDFLKSCDQETRFVISVNTIAPIEITRILSSNLLLAKNPRAIYIGATSGLDNNASIEVANTASKFALRGAIQALRITFQKKIGFTVINPSNIKTPEVILDIKEGRFPPQKPIPLADLMSTIDWILILSPHVDVPELNLRQR